MFVFEKVILSYCNPFKQLIDDGVLNVKVVRCIALCDHIAS